MSLIDPVASTAPVALAPASAIARLQTGFIGAIARDFHLTRGAPIDTIRVSGAGLDPQLGLSDAVVGLRSSLPARLTIDLAVVGVEGHGFAAHSEAFAAPRVMNGLLVGFYDIEVLRTLGTAYPMLNAVDVACNRLAGLLQEAVLVHALAHDAASGTVAIAWSAMAWDARIGGDDRRTAGR